MFDELMSHGPHGQVHVNVDGSMNIIGEIALPITPVGPAPLKRSINYIKIKTIKQFV